MNVLNRENNRRHWWMWLGAGIAVLIAVAYAATLPHAKSGPKLLNQATEAREVRPFSRIPDPRFAPLPIKPEKHGK